MRMEQLVSVRRKACPRSSSKADGRVRAAVAVVRYEDQNVVAKYISADKMDPKDAAQKWIDDNPDKVAAWLG